MDNFDKHFKRNRMKQKTLLITGSNRGSGFAFASYFYAKGYQIISINRTLKGEKWLGEIKCDLANYKEVVKTCEYVSQQYPDIDVCILNAAVRKLSYIVEMPNKDWQDAININFSSIFYTLKTLMATFKNSKTYVVVMGSHASSHYFDGGASYCSTKAALKALVEVFIQETRDSGIRTTLVNAGAINNRPKGNDDKKIQPESLSKCIFDIINSNPDVILGELEIRPSMPINSTDKGIDKLQYV